MKKELFPVKADGGTIQDKSGDSIAWFHATQWNDTTGGIHVHDVCQNAKDIASALNNTWGQGINPEAVPEMYKMIADLSDTKALLPNPQTVTDLIKKATLAEPEKDFAGKFKESILNTPVEEFMAPTGIRGMVVTCKTDDCKSLTNGKDYKVTNAEYRGGMTIHIYVVNDQGHNAGYYFTTFTEPRVAPKALFATCKTKALEPSFTCGKSYAVEDKDKISFKAVDNLGHPCYPQKCHFTEPSEEPLVLPEPKVVYCLDPEGMFLTKDKAYTVLNEDTDKAITFITNDRGKNKWYNSDMFTSEKPKKWYAVCINNASLLPDKVCNLTKNKVYELLEGDSDICYLIIDDLGERVHRNTYLFSTPYTS